MAKYFTVLALLLPLSVLEAQSDTLINLNEYIEYLSEESTVAEEDSQLPELIEELINNPVNINLASARELLVIPLLDFPAASKIIDYRNTNGYFFSKQELYSVDELSNELVRLLLPLISVKLPEAQKASSESEYIPIKLELRSRFQNDLQNRRGFETGAYKGSKLKSYQRIRMDYNDSYTLGLLAEKDPGERSFSDFNSFYLRANNLLGSDVILGDFTARHGQGLILWSPYGFSKGSEAVATINRNARTFYPNTSTDENRFFRGAAVSYKISKFELDAFYSSNKVDANVDDETGTITSLDISGYHRTANESAKSDKITNLTFGAKIGYSPFKNADISVMHLETGFNKLLTTSRNYFRPAERFGYNSASYAIAFERLYLTGETATDNYKVATINNLTLIVSNSFSAIVSVRNYPDTYFTLFGNGMGEGSNTSNEFGIYTGFKWNTGFGRINFYFDQFKFPSPTKNSPLPLKGHEFLLNYSYRLAKGTRISFRYISETKETIEENQNALEVFEGNKSKYRLNLELNPTSTIRLKSQIEFTTFNISEIQLTEKGYLAYQDAMYDYSNLLRLYARLELFNTDSYNTRLYAFENDLAGVLYNPALFGKGMRWYFLVNYKPLNFLKLSLKYSETYKPGITSISSGYSEIPGNIDNRISFQVDLTY